METASPEDSDRPEPEAVDGSYERFHLETEEAPPLEDVPPRFKVDVGKWGLTKLLVKELVHYRGNLDVVLSRPCVYGVFSGPLGGYAPRDEKCVGCLRCTTQYPEIVDVRPNPDREQLGDGHLTPEKIATILGEARKGDVPVRGQGYRGRFGGEGWDGMWTDMSEIVRPTRDGIHGREFISTAVDLGSRPDRLTFDDDGQVTGPRPRTATVQLPILFDAPPRDALGQGERSRELAAALANAAREAEGVAILPLEILETTGLAGPHVAPLVAPDQLGDLPTSVREARLVELGSLDPSAIEQVRSACPQAVLACRVPAGDQATETIDEALARGIDVVHLCTNYHGQSPGGRGLREHVRLIHRSLVDDGVRDRITLLGSGGLVAAEHVPKAILAGCDAVALDTAPLAALQAQLTAPALDRATATVELPDGLTESWGRQRLVNLLAAWRDQLLEIMGAMGLREVRRLRGEMGRAMDQKELEREAFGDIPGFPSAEEVDDGVR